MRDRGVRWLEPWQAWGDRLPGLALLIAAGLLALLFLGGQTPGCLGPLGVTPIQCMAASGMRPSVGLAGPVISGLVAFAVLWLGRPPLAAATAALAAGGCLAGAVGYLTLRPTTMTGPTSSGQVITINLPLDPPALVAAAIAGAAAGLIIAVIVNLRR